jgi:hypothetical protein
MEKVKRNMGILNWRQVPPDKPRLRTATSKELTLFGEWSHRRRRRRRRTYVYTKRCSTTACI